MGPLPIASHNLLSRTQGRDAYRWHVALEENGASVVQLVVDLPESQAVETELGVSELDERLPAALQRFAAARLERDVPVLDQVGGWGSPIVLQAEHFR